MKPATTITVIFLLIVSNYHVSLVLIGKETKLIPNSLAYMV